MIMKFLEFTFQGFWYFWGVVILLCILSWFVAAVLNTLVRVVAIIVAKDSEVISKIVEDKDDKSKDEEEKEDPTE